MSLKSKSMIAITIPINENTCENCVDRLQKSIKKLLGVLRVKLELENNQALVVYDSDQVDLPDIQNAFVNAGLSIPTSIVALNVLGMTCISCSVHVESALLNVPGVLEAEVSLAKASVKVTSIKGLVTTTDIEQAIRGVGYKVKSLKVCPEIASIENFTA